MRDIVLRRWLLAVFLALHATVIEAADQAPVLTGVSHGVHDQRLRLVLDVTPAPAYALFTLKDPDRLVLDFPALDWRVPDQAFDEVPYIAAVRFGLFRRDRARVVMDLSQPVGVDRVFTQPSRGNEPGRLVIDLSPVERAVFDARAGTPQQARWQGEAPAVPARTGDGDMIVAIDPGHGGIDAGASAGAVTEKALVLEFSVQLAAHINAQPGMQAYLIREGDEFVPLAERVARAHRARANILLSIHADSVVSGRAQGVSVYTLSDKGSDDAAEALAARENRADVIAGADLGGESDQLTRLLVELAQRGTADESTKLAVALLGALRPSVTLLRSRPHRQANFRVLKAPDIPSVLLELGFLDSPEDLKRLTDPEWQARAAAAVAKGVSNWRTKASPGFVRPRQ